MKKDSSKVKLDKDSHYVTWDIFEVNVFKAINILYFKLYLVLSIYLIL